MNEKIEILIVEDNLVHAEQLEHILEQHGHKVSVEHTALLALDAIRQPRVNAGEVVQNLIHRRPLTGEQSFANHSGQSVAGSVNVLVNSRPRVRANECQTVAIPNLDPCIFGLRMDVEYPAAGS